MIFPGPAVFCLFFLLINVECKSHKKEHKVHNIVLYPHKHAWCNVTPIKQIVSHPKCNPVTLDNNVCVGGCFSYTVPKTIPETPGDEHLEYCDSCQPSDYSYKTVTLECPNDANMPEVRKVVQVIRNCSCHSCSTQELIQQTVQQVSIAQDIPELFMKMVVNHTNEVVEGSLSPRNMSKADILHKLKELAEHNGDEEILKEIGLMENDFSYLDNKIKDDESELT